MNVLFCSVYALNNISDKHFSSDLMREFVKQGHNVHVITTTSTETEKTSLNKECGANILRIKVGAIQKVSAIKKIINIFKLDYLAKRLVKKYFKGIKFDLVVPIVSNQVYYKFSKYLKKRDNAKVYMLIKDMFPENALDMGMLNKKGLKGLIYKYFLKREKNYYLTCNKIGCMTPKNVEFILKHHNLDSNRLEVNPNSIMPEVITLTDKERADIFKKYNLPTDKKIVIYGGNLGEPQGVDFLISIIKNANDNVFYFILGAGTKYKEIEEELKNLNLQNAKLVPQVSAREYMKILKVASCGLVFLDKRFKVPNCPQRTLSYMEAKLPMIFCVGSECDIAFIAQENNFGVYVENGNLDGYYDALKQVLNNNSMGENGYNYLVNECNTVVSYNKIIKSLEAK